MHAVVFDCEFLTNDGAQSRFWCGPFDPDPVIVQVGLVSLELTNDFPITRSQRLYVVPRDRAGTRTPLDPFFTQLTGICEQQVTDFGLELSVVLEAVSVFAADARLWSWGKDEFNMVAISCFVQGINPPLPATRFGNACHLMFKAGMPYVDIKKTRSHQLAAYFGIELPALKPHDALDDALSTAHVLQHLLRLGKLHADDFR